MSISIIIPTLNEGQHIGTCLDRLLLHRRSSENLANISEIIVADGGSTDQTLQEIAARGIHRIQLLHTEAGRGQQQHCGATAASGDILLFLHCDTVLPETFSKDICLTLQKKDVVAGAFRLHINGRGVGFRLIEAGVRLRSSLLQLPYGDQALFMHRATYFAVGGFPEQPIMEDLALVLCLKKLGRIALTQTHVTTSARRWQQHGLVKATLINQLMLLGRVIGVSPQQLARLYYAQRK
ncbi:MAG: glycosyltransferase [Candidatus Electrothrix sp. AW1]|nr:glycosyltransferase [Candidatus Electrothrix sp. AX1]MCI5181500.1 glycosyltransferase [Candidatus Electrothrix gigas]